MSLDMEQILQEIGWSNGFHVPVANAENQALEAELERLTAYKSKTKIAYENAHSRYEALEKHLKFVTQEAEQNQKLITAYNQQIINEDNKLKATIAEDDRINQEIRHMLKQNEDISHRNDIQRNDLEKSMLKLEKLKAETAWDGEALKAWEDSLKKRDEDNELLKKFAKADEHKANELEARRAQTQLELTSKRDTVARMVAEITNYEQILERIGKIFKKQDEERAALVGKWQEAVKHLRQRDEDINRTNKDIYLTQMAIANQQDLVDEQNMFLNNEKNNNKALEDEMEEMNQMNSRMRKELNNLVQYLLIANNEANALKRAVASTGVHLEKERKKSKNLDKELQNLKHKISKVLVDIEVTKERSTKVNLALLSASERADKLKYLISDENKSNEAVASECEKVQGILYRNQVIYQELLSSAKTLEIEISGCDVAMKMMERQTKQKLDELQVQKELIYGLDYRINEMEVQIAQLEGRNKVDEETDRMNLKIVELEKILAEHNEVKAFLQGQVTRLEDEMRRLGIAISGDKQHIETLRGKLQDQILLFEGGVKMAAAAKLKSQQKQVEENVLRLKVSQLEKAISKEDDSIYDLHKFRIELETALRERQIEINTHKEILTAQRKNLDEARGRLRADINIRKIRIEQFQKKHHIALMSLGKDDDGQPLSITHIKIKNAQEKYMLQQEGDELDNKIKKAEKEIVAMENTLKIVNATNATYKRSLSSVDEESEEVMEMKRLEQEIINLNTVLKEHKGIMTAKKLELKELHKQLDELNEKKMAEVEILEGISNELMVLQNEEAPRHERLTRTCRQLRVLKKKLSKADLKIPERNLEIRQLQDANRSALHQLAQMTAAHPEVTPLVMRYIRDNELELPRIKTRLSSTSSSSVSTISLPSERDTSVHSPSGCSALSQVVLTFNAELSKTSMSGSGNTKK